MLSYSLSLRSVLEQLNDDGGGPRNTGEKLCKRNKKKTEETLPCLFPMVCALLVHYVLSCQCVEPLSTKKKTEF